MPADKKTVTEAIEQLQSDIQGSKAFTDVFGPVTFSGSDFDVALAFVKQLIQASSEELFESTTLAEDMRTAAEEAEAGKDSAGSNQQELFEAAMAQLVLGNVDAAREIIGQDEETLDNVIDALNEKGIAERLDGSYDVAISYYTTGLQLRPDEEGLRYNLARAYYEKGNIDDALKCLEEALQHDPDFVQGKALQDFIRKKAQKN